MSCEINYRLNELFNNKRFNYAVLLIGLPLSGKDTFLSQLEIVELNIISRDSIILEQAKSLDYNEAYRNTPSKLVDKLFYKQIREAAENKENAFINITHLTKKKRARTIQYFIKTHKIIGIQFPLIDLEEFRKRNQQRFMLDSKFIYEKVFLELNNLFEEPSLDEGYDFLFQV